jgi:starch-binding outer membrane protein, SusD/RagB family
MRIASAIALGVSLMVGAAGCHDYLSGPSLGANNPNSVQHLKDPTSLYVGLEAAQAQNFSSQFARWMGEFTQQTAGVARQQQGYDLYVIGPGDVDNAFSAFYAGLNEGGGGGGDARIIQQLAQTAHDSLFKGIAMVWEAMIIGEAASVWGDVPYSQAFNATQYPTPKYDPQMTVFKEVETTLDSALLYLNCTTADVKAGSTNIGPTGPVSGSVNRTAEIVYANRTASQLKTVYTAVAHTLKARFYMDMVAVDPTQYANALAQVAVGIQTPVDDWDWYFNGALNPNGWFAFMGARGDINPGAALINLMKSRMLARTDSNPDRFNFYFATVASKTCIVNDTVLKVMVDSLLQPGGGCTGNRPGGNSALPHGEGNSSFALFNTGASFYSPAVTSTENWLIGAEAALATGNSGLAQTYLNKVRANEVYGADVLDGYTSCSPTCTFASQNTVPATLRNIIEEKYIDLFGTPEVYNDYKRTCLPWLAAAPASISSDVVRAHIAYRLPYGLTSINADPNTPNVGSTAQNANQPSACPTLSYTSTPAAW